MTENEGSPRWLLPLIVIILMASVVLLFFASRQPTSLLLPGGASDDFRAGPLFRLPSRDSSTDPVDPCSLVEQAEVEDVIGRELSPPRSEDLDNTVGEKLCVFTDPDNKDERLVVIDVVFEQAMDPVLVQNDYDVTELYRGRRVEDRGIVDVSGIEDEAFWGGASSEIWSGLHVRSADVYLRVLVFSENDEDAFQAARAIAVTALKDLFE